MMKPRSEGQDLRFEIVEVKRTQWNIISRGPKFLEDGGILMECYGVQGNPGDSLEESVEETKQKEVGDGGEGEVNAAVSPISPRKRRRDAVSETEGKRSTYGVGIPFINLDVDEGVEELKREARGEKEKDDALAVEGAMRVLFGGERPGKEHANRMLGKIMKVLKAEVVEVEEEEE